MNTRHSLIFLLAGALSACGGGSSSVAGGVGTGGTGITWGTVTGFGSIWVNGVEYDDSNARIEAGDANGQAQDALAAIGQQVQVTLDEQGAATAIRITPQLIGPVAQVSGNAMRVMGQNVQIDATQTVVADALKADDWARIFGHWVQTTEGPWQLQATRIERAADGDRSAVLISGIVESWETSSAPNTLSLANGWTVSVQDVSALNPSEGATLSFWIDANRWEYTDVIARHADAHPPAFAEDDEIDLEGIPTRDQDGRLQLQGLALPPNLSIAEAQRARIKLKRVNGQWALMGEASAAPVRSTTTITGWTEAPNWGETPLTSPLALNLRNTALIVPPAVLSDSHCTQYSGPVRVSATASLGTAPLQVTAIACEGEGAIQAQDIADTDATITDYDPVTGEVTMEVNGESRRMPWPATSQKPANAAAARDQIMHVALQRNAQGQWRAVRITPKP